MAIFSGEVSHKNGLGRVRHVVATDSVNLANAFGVDGAMGGSYSNGKIGMLQLDGEMAHNEVAIDPTEMLRENDLDYVRSHVNRVVNFGALANALSRENRSELVSALNRIDSRADFTTLSDEGRAEVVKVLLGIGNIAEAKKIIGNTTKLDALTDTVRRNAVTIHIASSSRAGGVEYSVKASGTSSVLVEESRKLIKVNIRVDGSVLGSASNAGSKFKQNFVDIKKAVMNLSQTASEDRAMRFDPEDDIESTAMNIRSLLNKTARDIVKRSIREINAQFEDVEDFNPASVKTKLWNELNLTTSEIPQTKLDEQALRDYNDHKITALTFANMPENGLKEKVVVAVTKRLSNADCDAFAERIVDHVAPKLQMGDRSNLINKSYAIVSDSIDRVAEVVNGVSNFDEAYELYARPNSEWERIIIAEAQPKIVALLENTDNQTDVSLDAIRNFATDELTEYAYASFDEVSNEIIKKSREGNVQMSVFLVNQIVYQTVGNILTDEQIERLAVPVRQGRAISVKPILGIFKFKLNQSMLDHEDEFKAIGENDDSVAGNLVDFAYINSLADASSQKAMVQLIADERIPSTYSGYDSITSARIRDAQKTVVSEVVATLTNARLNSNTTLKEHTLDTASSLITSDKILSLAQNDHRFEDRYRNLAIEDLSNDLHTKYPNFELDWAKILRTSNIPLSQLFDALRKNDTTELEEGYLRDYLDSQDTMASDPETALYDALIARDLPIVETYLEDMLDDVTRPENIAEDVATAQLERVLADFELGVQVAKSKRTRSDDTTLKTMAVNYVRDNFKNAEILGEVKKMTPEIENKRVEMIDTIVENVATVWANDKTVYSGDVIGRDVWFSLLNPNLEKLKSSQLSDLQTNADATTIVETYAPDWENAVQ